MKRIIPFSRLTEFIYWKSNNCDKCLRYENRSTTADNAKCRLAFYLDLASVSDGTISLFTAQKIGIKGDSSGDYCTLNNQCNDFNKPLRTYLRKKKIDKNQAKLF